MQLTKEPKAVIFDCDGVIVDSEPLSCGAWNVVFQNEYGLDIGTDYSKILGGNTQDAAKYYLEKYNLESNQEVINHICSLKEQTYIELAKNDLKPIKDFIKVFNEARKLKWKVAVASSGILSKILFSLNKIEENFDQEFDTIVGYEKRMNPKPSPDIFLETAKRLSIDPEYCIVIEDTPKGIMAAKKASMFVIGITTTYPKQELHQADKIISSYEELSLASLRI